MRLLVASLLAVSMMGCASQDQTKVGAAATTPLSDLNLVHAAIPEVLKAARRAPYELPPGADCAALATLVRALDEALGPDVDVPPNPNQPGLLERGGDAAGEAAVGALQGAASSVVPFRSWVRKLTGAERYSREVAAAITAGAARRAFIKGVRVARGCPAAAP